MWTALLALLVLASGNGLVPSMSIADAEGGKDPMSELLHWAIEHSDPETLKSLMEKYKEQNLTIKDIYGQEVVDAFFKSEGDVMSQQIAVVQDFRNASLPDSMLQAALEELEELLHQVDHAGNLHRMGGMQPLLELVQGTERGETTRGLALWALGVAVQNNAPVQEELHALGGLRKLVELLQQCGGDLGEKLCGKVLFCLSGLVKNALALQVEADELGVTQWMMEVGIHHPAPAVVKKALGYLETVFAQNPKLASLEPPTAASLLGLVGSEDLDTSEKALSLGACLVRLRLLEGEELLSRARAAKRRCEDAGADRELCAGLLTSAQEASTSASAEL